MERVQAMGRPAVFPARLKPMLARLVEQPFSHPDWMYEPKLDGFRVLAFLRGGKNMVSIYSLRPLPGAPVSTPLAWDELDRVYPTDFSIETVPERVEALGELWADVLLAKHDLRRLLEVEH